MSHFQALLNRSHQAFMHLNKFTTSPVVKNFSKSQLVCSEINENQTWDPLSTNNLLSCLSTLLLHSYMLFCVRKYKLRSYIDSFNRPKIVRHINSKKMRPVSWFTKPVEQSGLMTALSQFIRYNITPNCPICRGSQTLIKKSCLSGLVLLTRQER